MKPSPVKCLMALLCALLVSCVSITVNVYFPEKDVKKAYKSLDDLLLKEGEKPAEGQVPPVEEPKEGEPKREGRVMRDVFAFSLVPEACAQESADEIAVEMASMPEVLKAYEEMKKRLPLLDSMRDKGSVGEGNAGQVVVRDKAKLGDQQGVVDAENANRKTVITGMAKATLKVTKQKETKETLAVALKKAATIFGENKREDARAGWWIQLPNGRWIQK